MHIQSAVNRSADQCCYAQQVASISTDIQRQLGTAVQAAITESLPQELAGPGLKAALEESLGRQLQCSLAQPLQDSFTAAFQHQLMPAFEGACRDMFAQVCAYVIDMPSTLYVSICWTWHSISECAAAFSSSSCPLHMIASNRTMLPACYEGFYAWCLYATPIATRSLPEVPRCEAQWHGKVRTRQQCVLRQCLAAECRCKRPLLAAFKSICRQLVEPMLPQQHPCVKA